MKCTCVIYMYKELIGGGSRVPECPGYRPSAEAFHAANEALFCEDCRVSLLGPACRGCGRRTARDDAVVALDSYWHRHCFVCAEDGCGKQLAAEYHRLVDKELHSAADPLPVLGQLKECIKQLSAPKEMVDAVKQALVDSEIIEKGQLDGSEWDDAFMALKVRVIGFRV